MGEEIKSALEIALEKIEELGELTEEERLQWKYFPEGEKLAARYLKQNLNLLTELNQYQENAKRYVIEGGGDVLIKNIVLPGNDLGRKNNKKAMDGLKTLKSDKVNVENIYSQIRHLFDHYAEQGERQRKQAYESLKADFETKIKQAMQQQLGVAAGFKIDVETQPQFQEEWRKLQAQLDSQYTKLLDEYKQALLTIP